MSRPSTFKSEAARAAYYRLWDEALALSEVPVQESDIETSFGTTHVLSAGDPAKPPLIAQHGRFRSGEQLHVDVQRPVYVQRSSITRRQGQPMFVSGRAH